MSKIDLSGVFDNMKRNADALEIIRLQKIIEQQKNVIRGHKAYQTKLIRTLNKKK